MLPQGAAHYVHNWKRYAAGLKALWHPSLPTRSVAGGTARRRAGGGGGNCPIHAVLRTACPLHHRLFGRWSPSRRFSRGRLSVLVLTRPAARAVIASVYNFRP